MMVSHRDAQTTEMWKINKTTEKIIDCATEVYILKDGIKRIIL